MAALDFPAAPTVGQYFVAGNGVTYQWNGTMWLPVGGSSSIYIGDVPPNNPGPGQFWFKSDEARLYIWYNDGNTTQWVPAAPIPGTQTIPPYVSPAADAGCKTTFLGANTALGNQTWTNLINTGSIGLVGQKWRISGVVAFAMNPAGWATADIYNGTTSLITTMAYMATNGGATTVPLELIVTLTGPTTFTLRGSGYQAGVTAQVGGSFNTGHTTLTALRLT